MSSSPEVVSPDVIVDSREPEELYLAIAKACEGKIVVREAASTDIIIPGAPSFAMERKEVGDFIGTWQSNRLYEQMATLKNFQEAGYQVALLLVGNVTKELRYRKMKYNQLLNMIASVWAGWGITILPIDQEWAVPYLIKYLAGKAAGEKKDYKIARAAPRDATPVEQAQYILESMPGVGAKLSEKIRNGHSSCLFNFIINVEVDAQLKRATTGLTEKQTQKLNEVITAPWRPQDVRPQV